MRVAALCHFQKPEIKPASELELRARRIRELALVCNGLGTLLTTLLHTCYTYQWITAGDKKQLTLLLIIACCSPSAAAAF